MAVHVRTTLGHWPQPNVEGFQSPYMPIFEKCYDFSGRLATAYAVVLWLVIVIIKPFRISLKAHLVQVVFYFNSWFVAFVGMIFLPGDFFSWYTD